MSKKKTYNDEQVMPICSLKTMKSIIEAAEEQGCNELELLGITANGDIAVSTDYSNKSTDKCSNDYKNCICSKVEEQLVDDYENDYIKSAACNPYRRGLLYISDIELDDRYAKDPAMKEIIDESRCLNTVVCDNLLAAIDDVNREKKEIINNTINRICDLNMRIAKGAIDTMLEYQLRSDIINTIDMCYVVDKVENNKK